MKNLQHNIDKPNLSTYKKIVHWDQAAFMPGMKVGLIHEN